LFGLEENYSDPDKMDKLMDRKRTRQNWCARCLGNRYQTRNRNGRIAYARCRYTNQKTFQEESSALCRLLLQQPDVLLLDEPTTGCRECIMVRTTFAQYSGTVIAAR
jgi:ATPase subunit of ABC transporter with duplicated ATPase domains